MSPKPKRTLTRYERAAQVRQRRAQRNRDRIGRTLRKRERRRLSPQARHTGSALLFALSLAVGALAAWPALELLDSWRAPTEGQLEAIAVQGHARLTGEQVAAATGLARGARFEDIDLAAVEERVAAHPWIRGAVVARLPVDRLLIRVEEREPYAVLYDERGVPGRWIDENGMPFALAPQRTPASAPRLYSERVFDDLVPEARLEEALTLAGRVAALALPPPWSQPVIHVPTAESTEGWTLSRDGSAQRVLLGFRDLEDSLVRFRELLDSGLTEIETAERIDLRFSDRAVLGGKLASR